MTSILMVLSSMALADGVADSTDVRNRDEEAKMDCLIDAAADRAESDHRGGNGAHEGKGGRAFR